MFDERLVLRCYRAAERDIPKKAERIVINIKCDGLYRDIYERKIRRPKYSDGGETKYINVFYECFIYIKS